MRLCRRFTPDIGVLPFGIPSSVSLVSFGIIISCVLPMRAESKGDIELLRLVAKAHQANRAAIDTWQGHAHIESTHADANGIVLQDMFSVDFLSDCRREVTRWTWTHDERHVREGLELNGEPVLKTVSEPISAMTTRMGFYRRAPGITTREGERLCTLVIWPPERARRRSYSECFNPMWYLTGHMTKLTDDFIGLLVFLYGRVKNDGATHIIATRDGNVIILERGNESLVNRHTFDLSRGGNVAKYFAQDQGGTERREWTYEYKDGVWIPKTFVFNHRTKSPDAIGSTDRTWKVTFVENIVNEPIPVSEFSLKALGYKSDESLTDQRKNLPPIYEGARTWDQRILREAEASPPPAPYEELPLEFAAPLLGKPLPDLNGVNLTIEHRGGQATLVYFFDLNQRPSRHYLAQLTKRSEVLKENGVYIIAIQIPKVEKKTISEWVKENNIPFPVRVVQGNEKKIRFTWAIKSLPWLILTDREHIIQAEGFGLDHLDKMLEEMNNVAR
jgi:hypothetical protein